MDWLANNWWMVMDWMALEWVENGLSILIGYIAFCVALVTLWLPASAIVRFFPPTRTVVIAVVVLASVVLFVFATFNAHEILNSYQHWYVTPLGPSL